jgi:hypothetical protein
MPTSSAGENELVSNAPPKPPPRLLWTLTVTWQELVAPCFCDTREVSMVIALALTTAGSKTPEL